MNLTRIIKRLAVIQSKGKISKLKMMRESNISADWRHWAPSVDGHIILTWYQSYVIACLCEITFINQSCEYEGYSLYGGNSDCHIAYMRILLSFSFVFFYIMGCDVRYQHNWMMQYWGEHYIPGMAVTLLLQFVIVITIK